MPGVYGTVWCASNHLVCSSERSGYLLCTVVHVKTMSSGFQSGQEARIIQIDFSTAFDRVYTIRFALWVLEVLCCLY